MSHDPATGGGGTSPDHRRDALAPLLTSAGTVKGEASSTDRRDAAKSTFVAEVRERLNATVAAVAGRQSEWQGSERLWTPTAIAIAQADARDFDGALATIEPLKEMLLGDLPGTAVQHLANRLIDAGQYERAFEFAEQLRFVRAEVYAYGAKRYAKGRQYEAVFDLLPQQLTEWDVVLRRAIPAFGSDAPYGKFVRFVEEWQYPTGVDLDKFVQYGAPTVVCMKTEVLCLIARQQAQFGDLIAAEATLRIALHLICEHLPEEDEYASAYEEQRLTLFGEVVGTAISVGLP